MSERLIRLELSDEGITIYWRDRIDQPWDDPNLGSCFAYYSYSEAADLADMLRLHYGVIRERAGK